MLSLQTLSTIEAMLLSKRAPQWDDFMVWAQALSEVQSVKAMMLAAQVKSQPVAPSAQVSSNGQTGGIIADTVNVVG